MADTSILSYKLQKVNARFQIDYAKQAALCFKETLFLCLKNEITTEVDSIGNCCISVENIGPQKCDFLIKIKFCMDTSNHVGGSKIICSATNEFDCLEEKRTEYVYHEGSLDKKTLYIGIKGDNYYVEATQMCSHDRCRKCKNLVYQHNIKLLSEGTNLLLMRYLAIINYSGELTYRNVTIDGSITICHYKCTAAEDMELYENRIKIYMIEHVVQNQNGKVKCMQTYLTPEGKILEHNWTLSSYMLKSESLRNVKLMNEQFKILIQDDNWTKDIELFSKLIDEKCHEVANFIEYLNDHSEVKHLIADYAQTLLIVKPLHVVNFTIQHFKTFSMRPEIPEFISTKEISQINMSMQQNEFGQANICGVHHVYKHYRMFEQKNISFQGSINSYCSTNSLCPSDITCIERARSESNTTVVNLDILMEHKTEREEDDRDNKYNFNNV